MQPQVLSSSVAGFQLREFRRPYPLGVHKRALHICNFKQTRDKHPGHRTRCIVSLAHVRDEKLRKLIRPRLGGFLQRLHERLQVKPSQTFVVKLVLKPSAAYTGKVKP